MTPKRKVLVMNAEPDPFPFSEEELFEAFKLVSGSEEARTNARMLIEQVAGEPHWEMPLEALALLALGSASAAEKVTSIRQRMRPDRESWLAMEMHRAGLPTASVPPASFEARWLSVEEADERAWQGTLAAVRNRYRQTEEGKVSRE